MAMEFESIEAAQLYLEDNKCNVDHKMNEQLLAQRYKCTLYRLMHKNNDTRELDHYLGKLVDCLARDQIFPPAPKLMQQRKYEDKDITDAQAVLTHVINSKDLVLKRGLVLLGLRISASFINIFCPPPDERLNRRFLVNPEKLMLFIKGEGQPLRFHLSAFCNNNQDFPIDHCVISCCTEWNSLMPWLDHEQWSGISANAPSVGLIANTNRNKRQRLDGRDGGDVVQYIEHAHQFALE